MQGSTLTPRGSELGLGSLFIRGLCLVIKLQDGEVGTRMGSGHGEGSSHWEPWCCHGRPAYFNSFLPISRGFGSAVGQGSHMLYSWNGCFGCSGGYFAAPHMAQALL